MTKRNNILLFIMSAFAMIFFVIAVAFVMPVGKASAYTDDDGRAGITSATELIAALREAEEGATIQLSNRNITIDLTESSEIVGQDEPNGHMVLASKESVGQDLGINDNITLDLNGKTLTIETGSEQACIEVLGVTFTVKNGSLTGISNGVYALGDAGSSINFQDIKLKYTNGAEQKGTVAIDTEGKVFVERTSFNLNNVAKEFDIPDGNLTTDDTLQSKILLAEDGETITLDKNYEENVIVSSNKNITIALNQFAINADSSYAVINYGKLTIHGGTLDAIQSSNPGSELTMYDCTVQASTASGRAIYLTSDTAASIENCTVKDGSYGIYLSSVGQTPVTVENCTIENGKCGIYVSESKVEITGGSISVSTEKETSVVQAILGKGDGGNEVTVKNCTITAKAAKPSNANSIEFNAGKLTIDNGEYSVTGNIDLFTTADVQLVSGRYTIGEIVPKGNAALTITGGSIISETITDWFNPVWLVDGETFYALRITQTENEYIVNEYDNNDTDALYIGGYAASVDGVNYTNLADALANAEGKTLKLLANVAEPITISANMTLDLGVANIDVIDGYAITVGEGVKVVITGSGRVSGEAYGKAILNNGAVELQGGTYEQDIDIDWISESCALAYDRGSSDDSTDDTYTVNDEIVTSIKRNGRIYNFSNTFTPFSAGIIESGETLILQQDIVGGLSFYTSYNGKEYTFDLNGHNIKGQFLINAGTLNIINTQKTVSKISHDSRIFQILPEKGCVAKLTIGEGVTIEAGEEVVYIQAAYSTQDLKGASDYNIPVSAIFESSADLTANKGQVIVCNGAWHGTEISLNGGSVVTKGDIAAIYHPQYGTLNIKDTKIEGACGIELRAGELNISGNTVITATAKEFIATPNGNGTTMSGVAVAVSQHTTDLPITVNITGGTFNGVKALYEEDLQNENVSNISMAVTGGTFESDVESENVTGFISGGSFKVLPSDELLGNGYAGVPYNGYYVVFEETADTGALTVAKLAAQADIRSYSASLGFPWTELSALSGNEKVDAILSAYNAVDAAESEGAVAVARLEALDAIDAYHTYLKGLKKAAIVDIGNYAKEGQDKAGVAVPTYVISAINGAVSEAEIDSYVSAAKAEIDEIRAQRTELAGNFAALNTKAETLAANLKAALDGLAATVGTNANMLDALQTQLTAVETNIKTEIIADIEKLLGTAADEAGNQTLFGRLAALETALQTVQTNITKTVTDAVTGVSDQVDSVIETLKTVADSDDIAALTSSLKEIKGVVDGLEGSIGTLGEGETIVSILTALQKAQADLESSVAEHHKAVEAALTGDGGIQAQLRELAAAVDALPDNTEDIAELKALVTGVQTDVAKALESLGALDTSVDGVETDLAALAEVVDGIASVQNGMNTALTTLAQTVQNGFDTLGKQATDLSAAVKKIADAVDALQTASVDLSDIEELIGGLQADIEAANAALEGLDGEVSSLASLVGSLDGAQYSMNKALEAFEDAVTEQLTAIQTSLTALAADADDNGAAIAVLQQKADEIAADLQSGNADLTDVAENVVSLQGALEALSADVSAQGGMTGPIIGLYVIVSVLVVLMAAVLVILLKKKN